jgi:hypothetical protein
VNSGAAHHQQQLHYQQELERILARLESQLTVTPEEAALLRFACGLKGNK